MVGGTQNYKKAKLQYKTSLGFLPALPSGLLLPWSCGGTASLEGVLDLCPKPGPEPEVEGPPGRAGKSGRTPRALPKSLGPRDSTRTFTSR